MKMIPLQIVGESVTGTEKLTQTIEILGYVPKRKDRQQMCIEYARTVIQPGLKWSKEQAENLAKKNEPKVNYAQRALLMFDIASTLGVKKIKFN